jgi:fatty-acyl-CoA synthase
MNPHHISHLVERNARKYADRIALAGPEERLDYCTLRERVERLAGGLSRLGVSRGTRVATLMLNRPELILSYLAIFRLGAILVPLNTRLADPEWAFILEDSGAEVMICEEAFASRVQGIRTQVPGLREVVCLGALQEGFWGWEEILEAPGREAPAVPRGAEDDLYILYTSGTTGRPKGAVITNPNLMWNAINGQVSGGFSGSDVVYYGLPLFHGAAIGGFFATTLLGGKVVLRPQFDPVELLELIGREGITRIPAVPAMLLALLDATGLPRYDLRSLKAFNTGATIIPQALKERLVARFPGVDVTDSYGLTEATSYCTILPGRDFLLKQACVGLPHAYVEIRVVDEQDQDVAAGELGEVLVRGPNVMRGYWRLPEETREALRGGWLHTGDLGRLDGQGYLYIVDRKKDMIISGGENVYPREVEEVLHAHPGVQEAAVVGVPDPRWGETVKAFIVPASGRSPSAEDLRLHCLSRLGKFKCPRLYEFLDALPRTGTGKVLKRTLRERAATGATAPQPPASP